MQAVELDEKRIASIVARVIADLRPQDRLEGTGVAARASSIGVFHEVEEAVAAAKDAQRKLASMSLSQRARIVSAIREASIANVEEIARLAHEETGYGRIPDKIQKKLNAARLTPGVEDIKVEAKTGDGGLVLIERVPFGLIASIEPSTHPGACVINHAISMVAAGNAVIFLPHPNGIRTTVRLVSIYEEAVRAAGGPSNLMVVLDRVSLDLLQQIITHPAVDLVVATGGPDVVRRALQSGKKAICAGPGNPPVIVDETVDDVGYAAKCIVDGVAFDNTVLCIAEKVLLTVDSVADRLLLEMEKHGAYVVRDEAARERLLKTVAPDGRSLQPEITGKDAGYILARAGLAGGSQARLAVVEVPVSHPLVQLEQMFPVLPLVRVRDFDEALELAVQVEHGFRHTAVIHSKNVQRITEFARRLKVDIVVANGPSSAGLAVGAEGHYSHTIASPTGEGVCTPRTYTREQRTVIVGALYTA